MRLGYESRLREAQVTFLFGVLHMPIFHGKHVPHSRLRKPQGNRMPLTRPGECEYSIAGSVFENQALQLLGLRHALLCYRVSLRLQLATAG